MKIDPFVYRAAIKIMWAMWLIMLPLYILVRIISYLFLMIGDFGEALHDFPAYIAQIWRNIQIQLARTLKEMENK